MADYLSDYQRLRCRRNLINDRIRKCEGTLGDLRDELAVNQRNTAQYERDFIAEHMDGTYEEMCVLAEGQGVQWHHIDSYEYWNDCLRGHESDWYLEGEEDDISSDIPAPPLAPWPIPPRVMYTDQDGYVLSIQAPDRRDWHIWRDTYGTIAHPLQPGEERAAAVMSYIERELRSEDLGLEDL